MGIEKHLDILLWIYIFQHLILRQYHTKAMNAWFKIESSDYITFDGWKHETLSQKYMKGLANSVLIVWRCWRRVLERISDCCYPILICIFWLDCLKKMLRLKYGIGLDLTLLLIFFAFLTIWRECSCDFFKIRFLIVWRGCWGMKLDKISDCCSWRCVHIVNIAQQCTLCTLADAAQPPRFPPRWKLTFLI